MVKVFRWVDPTPTSSHKAPRLADVSEGWLSDSDSSPISMVTVMFLTTNTMAAAFSSKDDPSMVTFVVSFYAFLMLFFWCMHVFNRLPLGSREREWMKVPAWTLATTLDFMFAHRVAMVMSGAMEWIAWTLALLSSLFIFYFFFIYREKAAGDQKERNGACEHQPLVVGKV